MGVCVWGGEAGQTHKSGQKLKNRGRARRCQGKTGGRLDRTDLLAVLELAVDEHEQVVLGRVEERARRPVHAAGAAGEQRRGVVLAHPRVAVLVGAFTVDEVQLQAAGARTVCWCWRACGALAAEAGPARATVLATLALALFRPFLRFDQLSGVERGSAQPPAVLVCKEGRCAQARALGFELHCHGDRICDCTDQVGGCVWVCGGIRAWTCGAHTCSNMRK